jgi:hypothetical protein
MSVDMLDALAGEPSTNRFQMYLFQRFFQKIFSLWQSTWQLKTIRFDKNLQG